MLHHNRLAALKSTNNKGPHRHQQIKTIHEEKKSTKRMYSSVVTHWIVIGLGFLIHWSELRRWDHRWKQVLDFHQAMACPSHPLPFPFTMHNLTCRTWSCFTFVSGKQSLVHANVPLWPTGILSVPSQTRGCSSSFHTFHSHTLPTGRICICCTFGKRVNWAVFPGQPLGIAPFCPLSSFGKVTTATSPLIYPSCNFCSVDTGQTTHLCKAKNRS